MTRKDDFDPDSATVAQKVRKYRERLKESGVTGSTHFFALAGLAKEEARLAREKRRRLREGPR